MNLSFTDLSGEQVVINSNSWRQVFDQVISGYSNQTIGLNDAQNKGPDLLRNNMFTQGRAAMTVDYSYRLKQYSSLDFNWAIVTAPVNPAAPEEGASIDPNELFGIHAESANVDAAWKLLEFIASEDYALISKTGNTLNSLSIYEGDAKQNGIHIEAFYKLAPQDPVHIAVPDTFHIEFEALIRDEMTAVIQKEQDLDTMLSNIESLGQFKLSEARKNEKEAKEG